MSWTTRNQTTFSIVVALIFLSMPCRAQQLLESYQAFLSERDHFNSSGQRLITAAAIIRQDRANFHRFYIRDPGDENDGYFTDTRNRQLLERLLDRGQIDPQTASVIVNGTPLVRVEVYHGNGGDFVVVRLVSTEPPPAPPSAARQPSAPVDVYGTAFFVSLRGHVLTNFHVVKDCTSFKLSSDAITSADAHVIASDPTNDLAVLSSQTTPSVVPGFNSRVRVGDSVFVYGFPLAGILSTSGNFTTGTITAIVGLNDNTSMLQVSAPVQPGNSGGPLIDEFGNIVGIVESKLDAIRLAGVTNDIAQNVNFAIKGSVAASFLESHGLDPVTELSKRHLDPANIADLAKQFTVRLSCR